MIVPFFVLKNGRAVYFFGELFYLSLKCAHSFGKPALAQRNAHNVFGVEVGKPDFARLLFDFGQRNSLFAGE